MDISVTVCIRVCSVEDFSTEDKASGVKFCTVVHRRPGQRISNFGELCSTEAQNWTNRPARDICALGCYCAGNTGVRMGHV